MEIKNIKSNKKNIAKSASENARSDLIQRLDSILSGAGVGCWDHLVKSDLVLFDARSRNILGLPVHQTSVTCENWLEKIHPNDRSTAIENFSQIRKNKLPSRSENLYRIHRCDGTWIWLLEKLGHTLDENGEISKITGYIIDVTRFKESEYFSESVQAMGQIGSWELDLDTLLTTWSTETYRIHGVAPGPRLHRVDAIQFYAPQDRERMKNYVENCGKGIPYRDTFELYDANGFQKWVEATGEPVRNAKGEVKKLRGTLQDVSLAYASTRALENIVMSMDDIVFEFDSKHNYANIWTKDESLLFTPRENLIGTYFKDCLPPHLASILENAFSQVEQSNEPFTFEYPAPSTQPGDPENWFRGKLSKQKSTKHKAYTLIVSQCTKEVLLREKEKKAKAELETFFSLALEMLCITTPEGKFKKVNPMWTEVLGHTESELIGMSLTDLLHRDDIQSTTHALSQLVQSKPTLRFESRFRTKSGSYKIISLATSQDPTTGFLYCSARDMTETRLKERELIQVMRAIDESAIVAITDSQGVIKSANQNFVDVSGYSREELVGKTHRLISSGEHPRSFFQNLWSTISSGKIWSGEIINRSKAGQPYTVQSVISPIFDLDGSIDSYLAIRFDITQQKESERLLIEAQRVAKIGSWSFDVKAKTIYWSDQMFSIFPEEKINGAPSFERHFSTVHPEDRDLWKETVERCIQDGSPYKMRFRAIQKNQTVLWIEAYGEAIRDKNGHIAFLRGTCQDISDLVLAEENLRTERAMAMQSAKLASLGEMSAGIAHEINNPLAIISGVIQGLDRYLENPEKFRKKVESIEKATNRISKIVTGLRKFSRTSNKNTIKPQLLNKIVEEALVLTGSKSRNNNVSVTLEASEDITLECDEIEIEQVLVNLINNAIDALKTTENSWVKVKIFQDDFSITLQVEDSGPGIPPHIREKIFQPFFTTKEIGEGTGLGLAIVKGIIEEHKGTISILEQHQNTCFEIRFNKSSRVKNAA